MHEFRPPQRPSKARIVILVAVVLTALVPLVGLSAVAFGPQPQKGLLLIMATTLPVLVLTIGMLAALVLLGPSRMRYAVGEGALVVKTLFGRKEFSLSGASARSYTPSRLWRVAGTGMPGYHTGIFRERGLTTRVYATDLKETVLVEGGETRVIVSPRNREGFLAALRAEGARVEGHGAP